MVKFKWEPAGHKSPFIYTGFIPALLEVNCKCHLLTFLSSPIVSFFFHNLHSTTRKSGIHPAPAGRDSVTQRTPNVPRVASTLVIEKQKKKETYGVDTLVMVNASGRFFLASP